MHVLSFRSLLLLFGFTFFVHALTVPIKHDLAQRNGDVLHGAADLVHLNRRGKTKPKTSKGGNDSPPATSKAALLLSSTLPPPPPSSSSKASQPSLSSLPKSSITASSSFVSSSSVQVSSSAVAPSTSPSSNVISSSLISISTPTASGSTPSSASTSSSSADISTTTFTGSISSSSTSSSICTNSQSGTCAPSTIASVSTTLTYFPRETVAVDVCSLPDVDCYDDQSFDDLEGVQDDPSLYIGNGTTNGTVINDPTSNLTRRYFLSKRNSRPYDVSLGAAGTITIKSLGYPSPQDLFETGTGKGLTKHAFTYKSGDIDDYTIKDEYVRPTGTHTWVVEHIIELQSVKMFIEYCVNAGVPGSFFSQYWNTEITSQTAWDDRPNKPITGKKAAPFKGSARTINNLIFQALGSSYNRDDFVLCQKDINSLKESAWAEDNFMDPRKFKVYAQDAAVGGVDSTLFLSPLRATLAVYEYFNAATVTKNLKEAAANVKSELGNVQHFTGQSYNLASLWSSFIAEHLDTVLSHGSSWLDDQLKVAEKAYTDEVNTLTKTFNDLQAEEKKQTTSAMQQKYKNDKDAQQKKLQDDLPDLLTKYNNAKSAVTTQIIKIDNLPAGTSQSVKDSEKRQLQKLEKTLYDATKNGKLKERAISSLWSGQVKQLIADAQKDQAVVAKFRSAQKALKMPKSI